MKNRVKIAAFFLLLAAGSAQAQYSDMYYHRTGDTIEWRSEIAYYDWWPFEYLYEHNLYIDHPIQILHYENIHTTSYSFNNGDTLEVLTRHYTPMPLRVVGLAGGCMRGRLFTLNVPDTDATKDYFIIHDAIYDSFPRVGQLEWNPFDAHRTMHYKYHAFPTNWSQWTPPENDSCCGQNPFDAYFPIYEYYFDSAITVDDSFYVGVTYNNVAITESGEGCFTSYWGVRTSSHFPAFIATSCSELQDSAWNCRYYNGVIRVRGSYHQGGRMLEESPWQWIEDPFSRILVYPLIEVDTTVPPADACVQVANVQVAVDGTTATVTWDDFLNYTDVRLRYGFTTQPQSAWTEVVVTGSTMHTLTGLQPTMPYKVSMRAICDKKETEWTVPVTFITGTDTTGGHGTEGVDETMLSRLTFLSPNPARDEFRVTSSFGLRRIEMTDLHGVLVYSEPALTHEAVVPTHELRPGSYIVTICTEGGTTHKRLLIAR